MKQIIEILSTNVEVCSELGCLKYDQDFLSPTLKKLGIGTIRRGNFQTKKPRAISRLESTTLVISKFCIIYMCYKGICTVYNTAMMQTIVLAEIKFSSAV